MERERPIVVVGVPRSGTTWVANVLASAPGVAYVEEPDNHYRTPFAIRARRGLPGREYPALAPGDGAAAYERLWNRALGFEGASRWEKPRGALAERLHGRAGRAAIAAVVAGRAVPQLSLRVATALSVPDTAAPGGRPLVKTVHAPLALEWLAARYPVSVLVVLREPLNVLASWIDMDWLGAPGDDALDTLAPAVVERIARGAPVPSSADGPLVRAAWLIGALTRELQDTARRHGDWLVSRHEELCVRPKELYRELAGELGLGWGDESERLLDELNRPGRGFEIARVAGDLPDAWRSKLGPEQVREAQAVLAPLGGT